MHPPFDYFNFFGGENLVTNHEYLKIAAAFFATLQIQAEILHWPNSPEFH